MKFFKAAITLLALSVSNIDLISASTSTCKETGAGSDSCAADLNISPYVKPRLFRQGIQAMISDTNADADADTNANDDVNKTPLMLVNGCCSKTPIGSMPQLSTQQALEILADAKEGWNKGNGTWTQMTLAERISAIQLFASELKKSREDIVRVLMYEIGKNYNDALSEFDRTLVFIEETIATIKSSPDFSSQFYNVPSTKVNVMVRRNAFGIVLALGPYNYPLNETYATIIPALLMGNVVVLKIPQVGGLAHLLTFQAFAKALPPNTINFISGEGRKTLPKIMESGDVDGLAFIGGSATADRLMKAHPQPHRLKVFLQLEAKNMAIVLKDMVDGEHAGSYSRENMIDDIITGALSYNGQRCTALKLIMVPKGHGEQIAKELSARVDKMAIGLPWEIHEQKGGKYSQITPLPNGKRIKYMQELMKDALSKGAIIANKNGGKVLKNDMVDASTSSVDASTLMVPAVIYNVTPGMKLYTEEQFGPLIPIVEYDSIDDVLAYGLDSEFGQQVSFFTNQSAPEAVSIVDTFSAILGKININSQCGRSPDSVPFTARRSSGLGAMSIENALREFSVPTVVSYKHEGTKSVVAGIQKTSKFMQGL